MRLTYVREVSQCVLCWSVENLAKNNNSLNNNVQTMMILGNILIASGPWKCSGKACCYVSWLAFWNATLLAFQFDWNSWFVPCILVSLLVWL